jgi:hypothetical protein
LPQSAFVELAGWAAARTAGRREASERDENRDEEKDDGHGNLQTSNSVVASPPRRQGKSLVDQTRVPEHREVFSNRSFACQRDEFDA